MCDCGCSERDAGYYSPLPYFLSQLLCDVIPMRVLPPIAFGAISYYMMGLNTMPGRFEICLVGLVLLNLAVCTHHSPLCCVYG